MCETTKRLSFLDLPAELRLRVYGLILVPIAIPAKTIEESQVDLLCYGLAQHNLRDKSPRTRSTRTIALPNGQYLWLFRALILACRQTYTEMEQELLRLYDEAFKALGWKFLQRHSMGLDTPILSRLGDTNRIKIGVPSTHIAQVDRVIGRDTIYEPTGATDDLMISLLSYFLSFSLYLAGDDWKIPDAKMDKTEESLHLTMSRALAEHVAGLGVTHGCRPRINNRLLLPNNYHLRWCVHNRPKPSQGPRMLQFENRL